MPRGGTPGLIVELQGTEQKEILFFKNMGIHANPKKRG
jgi:hypothetical protein